MGGCFTTADLGERDAVVRAVAVGSTGQAHARNSMSLVNVRDAETLTRADPAMRLLERQAPVPMFGTVR
jgi:cytochrome c peroxidase